MESSRYLEQTPWCGSVRPQSTTQRLLLAPDGEFGIYGSVPYVYFWGFRCEIIRKPTAVGSVLDQFGLQLPLDSDEIKGAIASIKIAFGLSTKDLAKVLGVERQTIYAWVREENEPRDENSHRMCSLLLLANEWNTLSGLPAKRLLRMEWESGTTLFGELCRDPLNPDKIRSIMQRCAELVNEGRVPRRSVEQILVDKGLDPAKYRVPEAEFDAATGKAHFSLEDWE